MVIATLAVCAVQIAVLVQKGGVMKTSSLAHLAITVLFSVILGTATVISSQTASGSRPAFEVASIKPLPPTQTLLQEIVSGKRSIGGLGTTVDGSQLSIGAASLTDLIKRAYDVDRRQIAGPDWLDAQRFEVHAKLPEGASKDQIPQMLQTLLGERFKLAMHWEEREQAVYALIVSKDGHKLKEAAADAEAQPPEDPPKKRMISTPFGRISVATSSDPNSRVRRRAGKNGAMIMEFSTTSMAELARTLTQYLDRPVLDKTELKGSYQAMLEISKDEQANYFRREMPDLPVGVAFGPGGSAGVTASDPSSGGIFPSVQQLGLKLDSRKAPVETLVIDHIEKIPIEN